MLHIRAPCHQISGTKHMSGSSCLSARHSLKGGRGSFRPLACPQSVYQYVYTMQHVAKSIYTVYLGESTQRLQKAGSFTTNSAFPSNVFTQPWSMCLLGDEGPREALPACSQWAGDLGLRSRRGAESVVPYMRRFTWDLPAQFREAAPSDAAAWDIQHLDADSWRDWVCGEPPRGCNLSEAAVVQ